jgi:hypothetical protein
LATGRTATKPSGRSVARPKEELRWIGLGQAGE